MGKRQRDCVGCGAPVGFIGREYCWRCLRGFREAAAKAPCPVCGLDRVLAEATGRCVRCSRRCTECGGPVRARNAIVCRPCLRRAEREAVKSGCPRCGRLGFLRAETGWCGTCSRPAPQKGPPRVCVICGELRRHAALGMCSLCWQKNPDRAEVRGEHLIAELADPPLWVPDFVAFLAGRHCPSRAATMIGILARLLADEHPNDPQAVLDRARRPGRSIGSLARGLQDFFTERRLAPPTDHPERLAAGRRQRRIDATPQALRPAVQAFAASLLQNRQRARAAATRPRTDHTIEEALRTMRDLAVFLTSHRNKADWALVDQQDIEAFIAAAPGTGKSRLTFARQFFRFARNRRIVLIDPTRTLSVPTPRGFTGTTLTLDQQRDLFHRWTSDPTVHPHEALLGVLALLHGAASIEVRTIRLDDIDTHRRTVRLGHRPQPVPLDPTTWSVLERCLAHRQSQRTQNPHLVVTRGTKAGNQPASTAYFSHLLDPAGVPPRTVRCTRLAALVNTTDPKLVAAAFGMNTQGVTFYVADRVDNTRLPTEPATFRQQRA